MVTDFICFSYSNMDFLIEKKFVESSFYFGEKKGDKFSEEIDFRGEKKLVVNFDYVVKKIFDAITTVKETMLISISGELYKTSSLASVKRIDLSEFRLFCSDIDYFLKQSGIIAVRFVEENRIQYLIDISKFTDKFIKNIAV